MKLRTLIFITLLGVMGSLSDGTPVSTQSSYDLSPGEHTIVCMKRRSERR